MNKKVNFYQIKEHMIDNIKILDLIHKYGLKTTYDSTNRHKMVCPFHKEETASMMIHIDTNSYFCWGCSFGGNIIDFIMAYEKKTFSQVILDYAQNNNISDNNYLINKSIENSNKKTFDLEKYIKNSTLEMNVMLREFLKKNPHRQESVDKCFDIIDEHIKKDNVTEKDMDHLMDVILSEIK